MRFYEFSGPLTKLNENMFSGAVQWFKKKLMSLFSSLNFGQTKSVIIDIPEMIREVKVSSVGYYHEWLIIQKLRDALYDKTDPVFEFPQGDKIDEKVRSHKQYYSVTIPSRQPKDKEKFLAAVTRAENSCQFLAEKIMQDIFSAEDILFIKRVIIEHVGADGDSKGTQNAGGKADIRVTAEKKDTSEVVVMINASIKIAVDGFVTLLTSGTVGVINKMFFPETTWRQGDKGWDDLHNALLAYPEIQTQYQQLLKNEAQRAILSKDKSKAKKSGEEETTKRIEKEMIAPVNAIGDFVFDVLFNQIYPHNKKQINENFLVAMGLDDADDVYYTLVRQQKAGTPEQYYFMSSRTSESYKQLYGNLRNNFTLKFERAGRADSATRNIVMTDSDGNEFWRSNIQFQQTGRGAWKLFMQDFQEVVDKHNETSKTFNS